MKLKGLVWFFTIVLIVISLWELSYTFAVRSHESTVLAQAEKLIKKSNPALKGEDFKIASIAKQKRILDSTKDKTMYLGSSYQKCKENELSLGLDLQGGLSVTMDVALDDFLKSLSNNGNDPQLKAALKSANEAKVNSDADFITLFRDAYIKQAGPNKLAGIFAGAGKEIKPGASDEDVYRKLKDLSSGAIKETYKILTKRIDKFGVAQPVINLDENKGIINVELAGVDNIERVEKLLTASANLQFWEVYRIDELGQALKTADGNLQNYLNGISDTAKVIDTALKNKNVNPFFQVINPINPQQDQKTGKVIYPAAIGSVASSEVEKFNAYLENDAVKLSLPADCKFLLGVEEKNDKGQRYFPLYAVKTQPGTDRAPLEGEGVEEASQSYDDIGRPSIKMGMTPLGAKTWGRLTTKNVGRPIAIALDNIIYSAPNINEPIMGGNSEIAGSFTVEQAQDLANTLKSGKVNAPAKIVAKTVVGPTIGEAGLIGGGKAFLISFIVIFALMLLYYNTAGWVANIALILNLLFTVGVLMALDFTLTAAGIAGLVLTIGMAVDTNVIIFERIKEELTKGKSYQQAVNDGYKRSLPPVLDAHVTTFLTAAILFFFGLGPVLGFATTQMIGIVLSLFCGILVSRLITEAWMNKQRHFNYFTAVSKRVFKHASYKFIEYRKYAYMISILVLLAGVGSIFNGFDEGVEFKGGRSYTVAFADKVKVETVRDDLKAAFNNEAPVIKTEGDDKHLNITTSYLKGVDKADSAVQTKLFQGLKKALPANLAYEDFIKSKYIQRQTTVQPTISDDLKRGAVKATIFALLIIFVYIFIRFRDWRYSAGTIVALLHDVLVTLAVFSFFRKIVPFPLEIDQHFIAAVLTVIGFSMNDTVIVFDRVREYAKQMRGADKGTIINKAINDTLSRTIMTSLTVFLTILILFIFGGEVTRGFAFAMLIGVITGTYSSIFVAAPILVDLAKDKPLGEAEIINTDKKKA
jgi:SecD/SecF fusion protein